MSNILMREDFKQTLTKKRHKTKQMGIFAPDMFMITITLKIFCENGALLCIYTLNLI